MLYPLILDTDPGLDDAIAIILLAKLSDNLKVIISSYGNVPIDTTTKNAVDLSKLLNISPIIIKGSSYPINTNSYETATHIHGENGLGEISIESGDIKPIEINPIDELYKLIKSYKMVDYITLGPTTNLAMLITKYPDVLENINRVVSMGGGFNLGNVTKFAEFNIYCDPIATNVLIKCLQNKITFVPLNTTHRVSLSLEEIEEIFSKAQKNTLNDTMKNLLIYNYYSNVKALDDGCIIHDATAVVYYLFEDLFKTYEKSIKVAEDNDNIGEFLIDKTTENIVWITDEVDREKTIECIKSILK